MELHYLITFQLRQEEKRGLLTYLVPNKEKAREVDGRVGNWAAFYTACVLPQASSHSKQAVIFQETHLKCK